MRLIDADALIMNLDDRYSLRDISREYRDTVVYELENAPTIDAVHVIRCKDCKHKYIENMIWHCPFGLMGGEDFFCGYGSLGRAERRNDED